MPNPYDILGVDEAASDNEVEAAYRRLLEIYHPDRFSGSRPEVRAEAERRMRDLNIAYDLLRSGERPPSSTSNDTMIRTDTPEWVIARAKRLTRPEIIILNKNHKRGPTGRVFRRARVVAAQVVGDDAMQRLRRSAQDAARGSVAKVVPTYGKIVSDAVAQETTCAALALAVIEQLTDKEFASLYRPWSKAVPDAWRP